MHVAAIVLTTVLSICLILYLIVATLYFVGGARLVWNPARMPTSNRPVQDIFLRRMSSFGGWQRLVGILEVLAKALCWPILVHKADQFGSRVSNLAFHARFALAPIDLSNSLFMAVGLGLVLLLHAGDLLWRSIVGLTAILFIGAVAVKLVGYITNELTERLRRTPQAPFGTFVAIAALDAMTLVMGIAIVSSPDSDPWPERLGDSAIRLFNAPGNLAELTTLSFNEILTAGIGLLVFTAFLRFMLEPSKFRRTDDDVCALASGLVAQGDARQARKWIDARSLQSVQSFRVRAKIALLEGDFDGAVGWISRARRAQGDSEYLDDVRITMVGEAALGITMPGQGWEDLVLYLVGTGAPDGVVSGALDQAISAGSIAESLETRLRSSATEGEYPLSFALFAAARGEYSVARALMDSALPGSELEELLRLVRSCIFICADPAVTVDETRVLLTSWFGSTLGTVEMVARSLEGESRFMGAGALLGLERWIDVFVYRYGVDAPFDEDHAAEARRRIDELLMMLISGAELSRFRRIWEDLIPLDPGGP